MSQIYKTNSGGGGTNPILDASVTLTSQQIKGLAETFIQVVPPPASGKVIYIVSGWYKLVYGGTSAFTNTTDLDMVYDYDGMNEYFAGTSIDGTTLSDTQNEYLPIMNGRLSSTSSIAFDGIEGKGVQIINPGGAGNDITGNPENNNSLVIHVKYYIDTL